MALRHVWKFTRIPLQSRGTICDNMNQNWGLNRLKINQISRRIDQDTKEVFRLANLWGGGEPHPGTIPETDCFHSNTIKINFPDVPVKIGGKEWKIVISGIHISV